MLVSIIPPPDKKITLPHAINILTEKEKIDDDEHYFLGYDPVLDQYKVVYIVELRFEKVNKSYLQHWVFVLEAGSSWKRISSSCLDLREALGLEFDIHFPVKEPHLHFPIPSSQGLCINGVVYYSAYCLACRCNVISVISFDVKTEELDMIQAPSEVYEYWNNSNHLELIEYGGKLTIFDHRHQEDQSGLLNLWVLEYAGKWSKKSLILHSCHMHFFPRNIRFQVIGTTQNGEVVLDPKSMYSPYYILYYDLHKNDVRRVDIKGISKEFQKNIRNYPLCFALMDTGESIMHLKI